MENKRNHLIKSRKSDPNNPRVWEVDFLRGLVIFIMMFDHFMWNWCRMSLQYFSFSGTFPTWYSNMVNFAETWWNSDLRFYGRYFVIFLLFFISGISSYFSKNNIKRSLLTFGVGICITIFSLIITFSTGSKWLIVFGILTCFGASMLIYGFIKWLEIDKLKLDRKWFKLTLLILGLFSVIIGLLIGTKEGKLNYLWPDKISYGEMNFFNFFGIIFGRYYFGEDWLGLFPSLGYFLLGALLAEFVYTKQLRQKRVKFDNLMNKVTLPFNFMGKYSVFFYVFHQPVLCTLVLIILLIAGFKFGYHG